eukprot:TRINITY_DN37836_c0_g1_i1.p1 TRINITY_DN37836_c0_g1~~TRINITY_DN37836_c0_g1_i1.p1  ORF type:complete len:506 (+),score=81.73 TRINITY_DN37836_c0_g1_i1:75-1520(+)
MGEGGHVLDKSKVEERFTVQALQMPAKRTGEFLKRLKDSLLNIPRRKNVEAVAGQSGQNLLLLSRKLTDVSGLPAADADWVKEQLEKGDVQRATFEVLLTYDAFSAEEVLRKLLPQGMEVPSSFEQAGHVCHLNLRDSQLPYKHLIAQVILEKNKSVRTVINKTGKIETEFRTFPMEHLAGEHSTVVKLKEQQCWFEFEYRDVYWNSRLQEEHGRLLEALFYCPAVSCRSPVMADCTCGIGPFSVPVTKLAKSVVSHANDLNPASMRWLSHNADINKLPNVIRVEKMPSYDEQRFSATEGTGSRLVIHPPGDARDFVRGLHRERHPVTHALFNLPATGVELLDCFSGLAYEAADLPRPLVCCYTFSDGAVDSHGEDGCVADLLRRVAAALAIPMERLSYVGGEARGGGRGGLPLPSPQVAEMVRLACQAAEDNVTPVAVRLVRNVAPGRHMCCVCFRIPVFAAGSGQDDSCAPCEKKPKLS